MDGRSYQHGVQLEFIRPGRPTENGYIEFFNGRLRDECINVQVIFTVADARDKLEQWRLDYNRVRPHSALGDSASRRRTILRCCLQSDIGTESFPQRESPDGQPHARAGY